MINELVLILGPDSIISVILTPLTNDSIFLEMINSGYFSNS
jgi:hypothetical protein